MSAWFTSDELLGILVVRNGPKGGLIARFGHIEVSRLTYGEYESWRNCSIGIAAAENMTLIPA